jgi:hypothetical protein
MADSSGDHGPKISRLREANGIPALDSVAGRIGKDSGARAT